MRISVVIRLLGARNSLIGDKIPLFRQVTNFSSNPLIWRSFAPANRSEEARNRNFRCSSVPLHVEPEAHHVAVLDDIIGALEAHSPGVPRTLLAAMSGEIGKGDRLGADEAPLEIAVDLAGGLRRLSSLLDGPGVRFFRAGGEEGDQTEEPVAGTNDAGETGLVEAECGEKLALLVVVEL